MDYLKLKIDLNGLRLQIEVKLMLIRVIGQVSGEHFKNYNINKITRNDLGVKIFYGEENEFFDYDKVVIATHADEALKIIDNPTSR